MSDRSERLKDFASAAGALTTEAMNALTTENKRAVAEALAAGAAHIRLIVVLDDPLTVVGALHSTSDRSLPPIELFRIDGSSPSGTCN